MSKKKQKDQESEELAVATTIFDDFGNELDDFEDTNDIFDSLYGKTEKITIKQTDEDEDSEIVIDSEGDEFEIETDEDEDEGEINETITETTEEEPTKALNTETAKNEQAEKGQKELSRSQKRVIESRNEVKKAQLAQLEAEQRATDAEIARLQAVKLAASTVVDAQKKEVENLRKQLKAAHDESDTEAVADLTSKLLQANLQLDKFQTELPELEKMLEQAQTKAKEAPARVQENTMPDAAVAWSEGKEFLFDNNVYASLKGESRKQAAKIRVRVKSLAQELMEEGFATTEPVFYEELDIRLANEFPEYETLAGLASDDVNSKVTDTSTGESSKKPQQKTTSEKQKNVPVKGPSTAAPSQTSPGHRVTRVNIPKADLDYHKKFFNQQLAPRGVRWENYIKDVIDAYRDEN